MADAVRVFGAPAPGTAPWHRPGCYAVILDSAGRMAIADVEGAWHLPGGGVDPGETYEQALVREVREETGLAVTPGAFLAELHEYTWARSEGHFLKAGRYHLATADGLAGPPTEPDHVLRWVEPALAAPRMACESHRWLVAHLGALVATDKGDG